jgi:hypothetical protein
MKTCIYSEKMKTIHLFFPIEAHEMLEEIANEYKLSKSAVVRRLTMPTLKAEFEEILRRRKIAARSISPAEVAKFKEEQGLLPSES